MHSGLETLMRPEFKLRPDREPPTEPASQAWSQPVDHVSSHGSMFVRSAKCVILMLGGEPWASEAL